MPLVTVGRTGDTTRITLSRPDKANALNPEMVEALLHRQFSRAVEQIGFNRLAVSQAVARKANLPAIAFNLLVLIAALAFLCGLIRRGGRTCAKGGKYKNAETWTK